MSDTKNDRAWQFLFDKYNIVSAVEENGFCLISAKEIKEFREPRLMTKFDHKSQLPKLFSENKLCILPTSRGEYIISNFDAYANFEEKSNVEIEKISFPHFIESIDYKNITSEAIAINCAFISGIIGKFAEDEELKLTVNGRMSSQSFDFNIPTRKETLTINVKNAQIEIDGGYEGVNSLNLIEAKNFLSKDFLVRQVYYPYRLWQNKLRKKVRNFYLTYTNGIFHFREYEFQDDNLYNSIVLVKEKKYVIRESTITIEIIKDVLAKTKVVEEPKIPFPQADSFERVINLCELLNEHEKLTREQITENYDFDVRQTNYYTDAGRYLGLIEKESKEGQIQYFLSENGRDLFQLNIFQRQLAFTKLILTHSAFNKTLQHYFSKNRFPVKQEIIEMMKNSNLYNIDSENTFARRASTVSRWVHWILNLVEKEVAKQGILFPV